MVGSVVRREWVNKLRIQVRCGTRRAVLLSTSPQGFLPGVDGYLSLAALGARRVSFDFERSRLSWE